MAYTFDNLFAVDPSNPQMVARNASILVYNVDDVTKAPVTLTDITGVPVSNPVSVNQHGFGPKLKHADLDRLAWEGGGLSGVMISYEGLKDEAIAARTAAQTAATSAGAAATADIEARIAAGEFKGEKGADGSNVLPTDTAIKQAIENTSSATRGALNAAYVRFEDEDGNPLPTRNVVIQVDSVSGEILDIVSEV